LIFFLEKFVRQGGQLPPSGYALAEIHLPYAGSSLWNCGIIYFSLFSQNGFFWNQVTLETHCTTVLNPLQWAAMDKNTEKISKNMIPV